MAGATDANCDGVDDATTVKEKPTRESLKTFSRSREEFDEVDTFFSKRTDIK